ncbi:patatin-like phospholipase family protein [Deefgea sp. CFH1-16]|uniref:patatin-like phospholipase family protein n=1 Tax=Deefgea sp. CFH1-16 TaxID=2675457 RepID=UPI0015F54280|nr:patatin-like phospholipase family protein [Deefgea sp. CFH1-16]
MTRKLRYPSLKQALLCCSLLVLTAPVWAERPRIGLVLGGGGARGFAHVGVIKVLEQNRIPIDCVIGTSIGSLVGAAYAAGRNPNEMQTRIVRANWDDLISSTLPRQLNTFRRKQDDLYSLINVEFGLSDGGDIKLPSAAISTQKIEFFLRDLTFAGTVKDFDQLAIPYRAIATDMENGSMVVQDRGDLVTAMRASMAVPGIFPAVNTENRMLVDGGLVRNLPVDVARDTCADVVIAVDVGSPPLKRDQIKDVFSVADQYTRLMMIQNVAPQLKSLSDKDVLITPEFGDISASDFKKGVELIDTGEVAANRVLTQLQRYSVSPKEYAAWQAQRAELRLQPKPVQRIDVAPTNVVNPEVLKNALNIDINQPLASNEFHDHLMQVYAKGDHSQLDYELRQIGDGEAVSILPIEKSWGPNYLKFGLSFATDFSGSQPWNISAQYRRTWLNDLGAEWKTTAQIGSSSMINTEFYQPLLLNEAMFLATYYRYFTGPLSIWQGDQQFAEYEYDKSSVGLDFGSVLSTHTELRIGPVFNEYSGKRSVGSFVFPESSNYDYGLRFNAYYDNLDHYFFPKNGSYFNAYGYYALGAGKQQADYARYGFVYRKAMPIDNDAIHFTLKAQNTYGEQPPFADVKWLGGFLNLSSYNYQELVGERFVYGSLQYLHATSFLSGSYIGSALEVGGVFDTLDQRVDDVLHYSASVYLAYDSFLGPLYFGAAYGDNRQARFYMMLGKQF